METHQKMAALHSKCMVSNYDERVDTQKKKGSMQNKSHSDSFSLRNSRRMENSNKLYIKEMKTFGTKTKVISKRDVASLREHKIVSK